MKCLLFPCKNKKLTKRITHPSERCWFIVFPSFVRRVGMNSLRNSLRLAGGISSTLLDSPFFCRNVVRKIISLSVFAWVFLFSWSSIKPSTVPSRRANRYITAIFFPFSSRNPLLFIGFCIFGYHGNVKSFAPLIGIHAHCRSAS